MSAAADSACSVSRGAAAPAELRAAAAIHRRVKSLLVLSAGIDRINRFVGRGTVWLILLSVLVSAGNAVVRKAFGVSSNAWLEAQWYLFAAAFLGCAGYVLLVDEHVRIDALSQRFAPRVRVWIDIVALAACVLPLTAIVGTIGWELFARAWTSGEMSSNTGGLVRWPVYLCIPVGMALLGLQALSELIKRVAHLRGLRERPSLREEDLPPFMPDPPAGTR